MNIEVKSHWGITVRNEYIVQSGDTLTIILPGGSYTTMAPLLYYAFNAAVQSGYDVLAMEYGFQRAGLEAELNEETYCHLVNETGEAIQQCLKQKDYHKIIFIGKCLGSYIQTRLIDVYKGHKQKHIFLTPWPECIEGIVNTNCLVILGANDPVFKDEHIKAISGHSNVKIKTIKGADHSLEKDDIKESLNILMDVSRTIYESIQKMY